MMTQTSRNPMRRRRVWVCTIGLAALSLMACASPSNKPPEGEQPATAQTAPMRDFQERLQRYLDLRTDLASKLEPMSPTTSSAELAARQESLAAALQTARAGAKPGDLIPDAAATQITAIVVADFDDRTAKAERATFSEVANAPTLAINRTYPAQEALATVPALLLNKLPPLPDNLQYRFYGRHLVILDGDVQIIVDYIADILPPHAHFFPPH